MSTTSRFVRPTNIGTFFRLGKLMRTLSGVNCHGLFRRNVPYGQDVRRAQSLCDLREFEPIVSSAVRPSGRGVPSLRENRYSLGWPVRRLIRADRYRSFEAGFDPVPRLDLSPPIEPPTLTFMHALRFPAPNIARAT